MEIIDLELSKILNEVDAVGAADGLSPKNVNVLRLLAEESHKMIMELLKNPKGEFSIDKDQKCYSLNFRVNATLYKKDKKEFLSLAKDNKNIYSKGILGKIANAIDNFFTAYDENSSMISASVINSGAVFSYYSMNSYMSTLSVAQKKEEWDGLEKSILVNFADDILVGARSSQVEIIIKKNI